MTDASPRETGLRQDGLAYGALLTLAVVWGSSFALMVLALEDVSPLGVAVGRAIFAALTVGLIAGALGQIPRSFESWAWCAALGALGILAPFTLVAWGQQFVPTSVAAILLAGGPLFMLLFTRLLGETVSLRRWLGFGVGLLGIVTLMGPEALLALGGPTTLAQLACLSAAACNAATSLLIRRMPPIGAVEATAGSQIAAACLALPLVPFAVPSEMPGQVPLFAILFLGIVQTGLAQMLRYWTVKRSGPVFLSTVGYLIPLWATFLGLAFLGEALSLSDIAAFLLILGGLAIAQSRGGNRPR